MASCAVLFSAALHVDNMQQQIALSQSLCSGAMHSLVAATCCLDFAEALCSGSAIM